MVATMNDTMLGTEIGRYRLTRLLGEGGMGRVYLAEQPAIGSRVAIKVLSDECARNPELLERFFAEARAVNLIRHENIISVLDLSLLPDGRPFIIMEYIEGHTLAHHVRKQAAPLGGVAQVMGEVLGGLAAAHAIGIVHRDMKPDNVLVTVEGHAKVLDFGIAKLAPGLRAEVSPRTKTGALLGTPAYMAPEQISGAGNVDARTDIYAAGIVLYEATTGVQPFTGATAFDLMRAHLEEAPVPPRQHRGDIPPALEEVILQAIAKDPAHRFQTAHAMQQALHHAAQALPPEQWQPLSTRGGPRISASGVRPPTTNKQATPDAFKSTAVAPAAIEVKRRRAGRVIAIFAAAAIVAGVTLVLVAGGGDDGDDGASRTDEPQVAVAEPAVPGAPNPDSALAPVLVEPAPAPTPSPAPTPARRGDPVTPAPTPSPAPTPARRGDPVTPPSPPRQAPPPDAAVEPANTGVTIGPNVHIGPGVTIGTAKPTKQFSVAADYDPKNFDPIAYLPKALAHARKLLPDARLTELYVTRVTANGRADLTARGAEAQFEFRSVAASKRPAGVAPNEEIELGCKIYVELGPKEVTARVVETDDCDDKLVRSPRCSLSAVWKRAIADGAPASHVAKISWLFDEKWYLDTGAFSSTIPDVCP